jgi:branched-chain amino acid transport system ATP-binding protein
MKIIEKPAPQSLLEVENLSVSYGKIEALSQLSLRVGEGQIVTVIGPNGAGKSTMLSAIMGILPSRGMVCFDGSTSKASPQIEDMVERGMSLVPEKRALFTSMSVEDNLQLGAFRHRRGSPLRLAQALEEVYSLFPRLKERRRQEAATLSGGERQMLVLGRALMGKPRLLMLDEPSLGLAPLIVREIFRIIAQLRAQGVSILLIEQNARAALRVADYAYVLELGRVAMEGPAKELAGDPRVIEAYLGMQGKHQEMLST